MATKEQAAADLAAASYDVLLQRGWTQGEEENMHGQVCMIGAMCAALWGDPSQISWSDEKRPVYDYLTEVILGLVDTRGECFDGIPDWNDESGRTEDEVFDVFKNAEKLLRERTT